jgi:murein DD-endopeptidase MepM/ murein hydrolase activator NlpD
VKGAWLLAALFLALLLAGCGPSPTPVPETCLLDEYPLEPAGVKADDPFRYPLARWRPDGLFQEHRMDGIYEDKYHAAEDCSAEPGTPVYAIADGAISYSGPMDGYGWLIVIDHPQHDVYSLYGHLSSWRWKRRGGSVQKGDLIAFVGDSDENGSSEKYGQMHPHLHLGIRTGQRTDYPSSWDKRWMAGWIETCPESIGWLSPTRFIGSFRQ